MKTKIWTRRGCFKTDTLSTCFSLIFTVFPISSVRDETEFLLYLEWFEIMPDVDFINYIIAGEAIVDEM